MPRDLSNAEVYERREALRRRLEQRDTLIAFVEESLQIALPPSDYQWYRSEMPKSVQSSSALDLRWILFRAGELDEPASRSPLPGGSWWAFDALPESRLFVMRHSNTQRGGSSVFDGWFMQNALVYDFDALVFGTVVSGWDLSRAIQQLVKTRRPNYFTVA